MTFGERFLTYPDLFPARPAGEPCGGRSITLDIAGPTLFSGLSDAQLSEVQGMYGPGIQTNGLSNPSPVRYMRMGTAEFTRFRRVRWQYTLDLDSAPSLVRIAGYDFIGLIQTEPELAGAVWTDDMGEPKFPDIFENFYRIFVAYQAIAQDGLLMHSAGIVVNRKAYICYGHSNAGKSTISRLALEAGHDVLSDDLNLILDARSPTPTVRRIPLSGDLRRPPMGSESYPLAGIFHLEQGDNRRDPLSPSIAFATMIGSTPYLNIDTDRYPKLAAIIEDLVATFKPSTLSFSKSGGFWDLLDGSRTTHVQQ